ncbi:hypothetical protein BU24DRAFT_432810 [Aaosphaeria arxii CBS 175.79]|uniref:Clavaminate synthase-like protein n=1 Tax=Aaosphaeria arxii CBS 175.79 TaxID=1450172 RepID=A0A6A5XZM4_9PLEO|nr:uncharacterized protein BU24DRAFT_432810 [Aaosphaeria arxii CBS 175.79]KAF2018439.1 hypothetical protein BU24DRAFT_432810 [Aaosphaeria arxii CBS 175.79]
MMAEKEQYAMSQSEIDHFLEHGWVKLTNCFTREQAAELQATMWTRLGMDPNDMSTWRTERTNMPWFNAFSVEEFAPKAWGGICSLLGGAERVDPGASTWKDGFIVNLGTPAGHNKVIKPQELDGWHVDGDFFVHYLDSPEQALLVIPLWSDIEPNGGGTLICPPAIDIIAKHLYEHPEGVSPRMTIRAENPEFKQEEGLRWCCEVAKSMPDEAFVEATGVVGDVYLLHPLMLHSASNNQLRKVRVITNPPVSVKEPFVFDREDGNYSVVEKKTMKAVGKDRLEGWRIQGERQRLVPARVRIQQEMKRKEEERLRKLQETGEAEPQAKRVEAAA